MSELLSAVWEPIVAIVLFVCSFFVCSFFAFRAGRRLQDLAFRQNLERLTRTTTPAAPPVDAVADLLETKAEIRKDELRRWAEAWQRAAGLPDFWAAVQEIREVEYRAVAEDRRRRLEAERAARLLAIEEAQAERAARAEAERLQAQEERVAIERHQAHLAERRRRYAEAKRRNG